MVPEVLFLDIHMPGLSGFELLAELPEQPLVIFTTAYDRYALEAFRANAIDYLLKPIEPDLLERALAKAERMTSRGERPPEVRELLAQIGATLQLGKSPWLERIASRSGDKVEPIDLRRVTHFFSKDKLTFASTLERSHVVDMTISELEQKLDPGTIHPHSSRRDPESRSPARTARHVWRTHAGAPQGRKENGIACLKGPRRRSERPTGLVVLSQRWSGTPEGKYETSGNNKTLPWTRRRSGSRQHC